jgi:hypothetical protein
MSFKLRIPGRDNIEAAPVANFANPLIAAGARAGVVEVVPISGIAGLAAPAICEFEREAFDERAAIMQYDGGLLRADAEVAARACVACEFRSRRKTCLEPVRAGLADHFSIRFTEQVPDAGASCPAFKEITP